MLLHADAIAEDCAAGVWTGWIDSDNADGVFLLAVVFCQLIDEGALAGAGGSSKADGSSFSCVRE